jgi:hypothetical protein
MKKPVVIKHTNTNNDSAVNYNQILSDQTQAHSLTINKLVEAVEGCNCYVLDCNTRINSLTETINKQ